MCAEKYVYDHTAAENRTCGMPTRMEFYKRGTSGAFTTDSDATLKYGYDEYNLLMKVWDGDQKTLTEYYYDVGHRLTREKNVRLKRDTAWSYDDNGNITKRTETNTQTNATTAYSYSYTNGRLTSYNGQGIAYDALGNPTVYRGKSVTWTRGRLMSTYEGLTFEYDGSGRRIKKGNVTYTYDASGNLIESSDGLTYFYGMNGVFAIKDNGTTYFYRKDAQGNIIALLDVNGKVVVQYVYDAWGNHAVLDANGNDLTSSSHIGNRNPFRYRGYFYDVETGLYYLQTRYYDPEIGRFLNMDDISYADPEQIHGLNLYAYCANNPVNYVDPTGHFIVSLIVSMVVGAVIGGVMGGVKALSRGDNFWGGVLSGALIGGALSGAMALGGATMLAMAGGVTASKLTLLAVTTTISFVGTSAAGMGAYAIEESMNGRQVRANELIRHGFTLGIKGGIAYFTGMMMATTGMYNYMLRNVTWDLNTKIQNLFIRSAVSSVFQLPWRTALGE